MTTIVPLTPRQAAIYRFIRDFRKERGFAPTVREIAAGLGIRSPNGVSCHLTALRRKGVIADVPGVSRTLRTVGTLPHPFRVELSNEPTKRPGNTILPLRGFVS